MNTHNLPQVVFMRDLRVAKISGARTITGHFRRTGELARLAWREGIHYALAIDISRDGFSGVRVVRFTADGWEFDPLCPIQPTHPAYSTPKAT